MIEKPGRKPVITIDGPAGAGKSTLAKALAARLNYTYLDSGALYRTVALAALESKLAVDDEQGLAGLMDRVTIELRTTTQGLKVFLDGRDVSSAIRTEEVGNAASAISKLGAVRKSLTELQRRMGAKGGVVLEGRDAGTVVFPDAELKFFLTASLEERALRRVRQLADQGIEADQGEVRTQMEARDNQDRNREIAPLRPAEGAVIVDSTGIAFEDVLKLFVREAVNPTGPDE